MRPEDITEQGWVTGDFTALCKNSWQPVGPRFQKRTALRCVLCGQRVKVRQRNKKKFIRPHGWYYDIARVGGARP